nr:unnamed protein product [Naegleria fowleri]
MSKRRQQQYHTNCDHNEEHHHPLQIHGLSELPLHSLQIIFNLPILTSVFGIHGIVLYPFILFALPKENMYQELIQHEFIHARQIKRDGFFYFYLRYALEVGNGILRNCYSMLSTMIISSSSSSWFSIFDQKEETITTSNSTTTDRSRSTIMIRNKIIIEDIHPNEKNGCLGSLIKGLNRIMTRVSYEKEAYSLEHIELYESEKAYLKEHFDGLNMDELMSESEWHYEQRIGRKRKTTKKKQQKDDDEWEDVDTNE